MVGTAIDPAPVRDLADYTRPLRRRWWWVAIGVALGLVLGAVAAAVKHHTYTSTASVLVTPTGVQQDINNATGRTQSEINLDTEAQIVKSDAVAARVRKALHASASLATIEGRVSVAVPANTTVLRISYTAGSARHAADGAEAFATSYLAVRALAAIRLLKSQEDAVRQQIAVVATEARQRNAQTPAATSRERALRALQYKALETESTALATQLSTLSTTVVTPGRMIAGATTTSGRSALIFLLGGAMLGLLLSVGGALMRDRTDVFLRDPSELEDAGIRVVGSVDTPSNAMRTYTRAGNAILGTSPGRQGVVLVAAPTWEPREDDVALKLAKALRELAGSVALVSIEDGSTEMREVGARGGLKRAQRSAELAELAAATRGGIRSNLERMKEDVDFIVVNAADPLAEAVLPACDTALLVVSMHETRVTDILEAARAMESSGVRVIGAVVVASRERRTASERWPWLPEWRRNGDAPVRGTPLAAPDRTSSRA
jgi:Chain length determinant protein